VRPFIVLVLVSPAAVSLVSGQGKNPKCGDAYHYRWQQKTSTPASAMTPLRLRSWLTS